MELCIWVSVIIVSCIFIARACDYFEKGADYLGRNMGAGAKGSLIDALGSSMPELLVNLAFIMTGKPELILAGIAVTAGATAYRTVVKITSAIFNAVLIPAISILFVDKMELDRKIILRDGTYLLIIEGILIWILGQSHFTISMALSLIGAYIIYVYHVINDSKKANAKKEEYDGQLKSGKIAWMFIIGAVVNLTIFCYGLAEGIINIATILNLPIYIIAVTLGAAATSLPDLILSIKSAKSGASDDAVANAIGSNIFDISGATAIPVLFVLIYMFLFTGQEPKLLLEQSTGLTALRYFVWFSSALVVAILSICAKDVKKNKVHIIFFGIYATWLMYLGVTHYLSV